MRLLPPTPRPRERRPHPLAAIAAVILLGGCLAPAASPATAVPSAAPTPSPTAAASPSVASPSVASPSVPAGTAEPSVPDVGWLPPDDDPDAPGSSPADQTQPSLDVPQTPIPGLPTGRVATRVAVPALNIDLPVVRQTTSYPACRVAMYLVELRQPGQGGPTYLYAHAQAGMFLPLLNGSRVNNGAAMIGMEVRIWTGDSMLFTYRISEVRRHVTSLSPALNWKGESAWLQTSESRGAGTPKLQVVALPVLAAATDYASSHPIPHPAAC